jgi:glycerophosphoryl diester phosphodiesterase
MPGSELNLRTLPGLRRPCACTARLITPPTHSFIDNTLPSIEAALAAEADIVEIDVRTTKDHQFVLFHDYGLDCRTDGSGLISEHSLAELREVDVGYGYTADGGRTFPIRGKGVGMMPTLVAYLEAEKAEPWSRVSFFGAAAPLRRLKQLKPAASVWSDRAAARCFFGYLRTGWFGRVPRDCDDGMIIVPIEQATLLWGWPNRFLQRMREHHTQVMLIGKIQNAFSKRFSRLDTQEQLLEVPRGFGGLIWTDRIGVIGPLAAAVKSGGKPKVSVRDNH